MTSLDWLENDTRDPRLADAAAPEPVSDTDRAIATLADHDGWLALVDAIRAHEDAWSQLVASQVVKGTIDLDPVKIARTRGYFMAAKNLIGKVEAAKKAVEEEA
jgi:hypothetical protein